MAAQYSFVMKGLTKTYPGAQKPTLNNLMAALQQAELLLGAEEEFVLSGSYYRSSP